jgi:hypothetical protein
MRKIACLLTLLFLAAIPVAACGTDDFNPDAVAEAADKTAAVDGMRITAKIETEIPGAGKVPMTMNGVADVKGNKAKFDMDMGALMQGASGGDSKVQAIQDGMTMYMKMPMLEKQLGAEWMKLDMDKALEGTGIDLSALQQQSSSMNPAEQLKYLKTMGDVEEVDENHYKGTVDVRKMPGGKKLAELSGATTVPVELWINDDGYIERYAMTLSQKIQGQSMKMAMDMRFSDYGIKVDIEPPPSGDVKDLTDLAKKGLADGN